MIKYAYLVVAIFLEVTGTLLLPASKNFTRVVPTIILTICYILAIYLLTFVMKTMPIAIVYATWAGLGVFSIALFGYFFFHEALPWQVIVGLFLIVIGVVLVNTFYVRTS